MYKSLLRTHSFLAASPSHSVYSDVRAAPLNTLSIST